MGMFDLKGYSFRNRKSFVVKNVSSKKKSLDLGQFSRNLGNRALSALRWVWVGHEYK